MKKKFRFALSTVQIIMLSFLATVLLGSLLLSLPISSATGKAIPYVDALFTATTATCVTGLVTVTTATAWSTFGHVVILLLIQIGGLGIVTVLAGVMAFLNRKMSIGDRMLIQDAFNLNTMSGLGQFIKKVILGTLLVEGVGALLYMTVFIPDFGAKGIWYSLFTAVSAFCNAGIDLLGENSLAEYATNPVINFTTCALIILGGIGFIVWWDMIHMTKSVKQKRWQAVRSLSLHTKVALTSTLFLLVAGAVAIFVLEFNNPLTMKNLSLFDKIQCSVFQSVTTRTAGFFTLPQQNFTNASSVVCLLLMFIGGSPVGTAGGVKTVTLAVLLASSVATIRNRNEVTLFHRQISKPFLRKATAVVMTSFLIMFISTVLLAAVTPKADALDILYETVSATATVGLTRNLTPSLNLWGKLIVIVTMYLGRVGPISLAIAFGTRKEVRNLVKNPTEEISVG